MGSFCWSESESRGLIFPVIVVSGYLDDSSVARFKERGVSAIIWKLFEVAELIAEFERCIGKAIGSKSEAQQAERVALADGSK